MTTLVLGLGNLVHSDDGLGVHAIQTLQQDSRVPAGAILMDGGTLGLNLLPHISAFQRLLVIDALDVGEPAGTLLRMEGKALQNLPGKASVHQLGFADLMVALELLGESPEEIVLLGVQPLSTEWSTELTSPVREALGPLLEAVIEQLKAWSADDQARDSELSRLNATPYSTQAH
jgi:hydrogenase maturation protease